MSRDYKVTAMIDDGGLIEIELPSISLAERVLAAFSGHWHVTEGPHLWWRKSRSAPWRPTQPETTYVLRLADET